MPTNTENDTPNTDLSATSIAADALAQRQAAVRKLVVSKEKTIMKRTGQLAAHTAAFDKKVAEYREALSEATSPEQISAVVETFKFPAKSIHFTPAQDD